MKGTHALAFILGASLVHFINVATSRSTSLDSSKRNIQVTANEKLNSSSQESQNQAFVEGKIVDLEGVPISGVSIRIEGTRFRASTDSDGRYQIDYVPGTVSLFAERVGYLTEQRTFQIQSSLTYPADDIRLIKMPSIKEVGNFLHGYIKNYKAGMFSSDTPITDYVMIDHVYARDYEKVDDKVRYRCVLATTTLSNLGEGSIALKIFNRFFTENKRMSGDRIVDQFFADFRFNPEDKKWSFVEAARYGMPYWTSSVDVKTAESKPPNPAGTWLQFIKMQESWVEAGRYSVDKNEKGSWEITPDEGKPESSQATVRISDITVAGDSWIFNSDWGERGIAAFKLLRSSDDEYLGWSFLGDQQVDQNKWIRLK